MPGHIEVNSTLNIPNAQAPIPLGNLILTNNSNVGCTVILRLNGGGEERAQIAAHNHLERGIHDTSAVKNLGPALIDWDFI